VVAIRTFGFTELEPPSDFRIAKEPQFEMTLGCEKPPISKMVRQFETQSTYQTGAPTALKTGHLGNYPGYFGCARRARKKNTFFLWQFHSQSSPFSRQAWRGTPKLPTLPC